jgi:hypothetical protein
MEERGLLAKVKWFDGVGYHTWQFMGANGQCPVIHGG